MYLHEALLRFSALEEEAALLYARLAGCDTSAPETAASCAESSRRAEMRAKLLHAVAELSQAVGDDGPFLVEVSVQLAALRRTLDSTHRRLSIAEDAATAESCVDALDAAQFGEVYADLLEVAEPAISRVLRTVDSEISHLRPRGKSRAGAMVRRKHVRA